MLLIEALLAIMLGCFLGIFSGLAPGIHVNTIAMLTGAFAAKQDLNFALMVVSMTMAHSFLDFIPSILLGAPDAENFLSALPGHRMLLRGKALKAIRLCVAGCIFGTIISFALLPFFSSFVIKTISFLHGIIPAILLASLLMAVFSEKGLKKKFFAAVVVALSGTIGLLSLQSFSSGNELFALVTGFFGTSTIIFSLKEKTAIRKQRTEKNGFRTFPILKASLLGAIASAIVSLFPAIGPAQAAFIVKKFSAKISTEKYLVVLGAISTASSVFSFFVLYLIGKARTGTAVAVRNVLNLGESEMLAICAAMLIAAGLSALAANFVSKRALNGLQKIKYWKVNLAALAAMVLLVFFVCGARGMLLLFASTATGLAALGAGVKRTNCMAFLILPTISYYLK